MKHHVKLIGVMSLSSVSPPLLLVAFSGWVLCRVPFLAEGDQMACLRGIPWRDLRR